MLLENMYMGIDLVGREEILPGFVGSIERNNVHHE